MWDHQCGKPHLPFTFLNQTFAELSFASFFYKLALKSQKHISDKLIRKDTGLTVGQRNLNWDRREGTTFLISSLFSAVSKMQNQQKMNVSNVLVLVSRWRSWVWWSTTAAAWQQTSVRSLKPTGFWGRASQSHHLGQRGSPPCTTRIHPSSCLLTTRHPTSICRWAGFSFDVES